MERGTCTDRFKKPNSTNQNRSHQNNIKTYNNQMVKSKDKDYVKHQERRQSSKENNTEIATEILYNILQAKNGGKVNSKY